MSNSLEIKPKKEENKILCYYQNVTNKIKILRINNNYNSYSWKRVVFPDEMVFFEGIANAELEIREATEDGEIISEKMLCDRLLVEGAS